MSKATLDHALDLKASIDALLERYSHAYRLRVPGNWTAYADGSIHTDNEIGMISACAHTEDQEVKAATAEIMSAAPTIIAELRKMRKLADRVVSSLDCT